MKKILDTTFSSLKIRNYRLYYIGQSISLSGTFLQALAQDWLVLQLTNSGVMLGVVSALQFLPMLVLMPWGGVIADRFPKLKVLFATQTISGVLSLIIGAVVLSGHVQVWMIMAFALCFGLTNAFDYPTRQAFVFEMVGKEQIKNAVNLWAMLISVTRIIGPALAGILIAVAGIGNCFIINAITYAAVLAAFLMIDRDKLHVSARAESLKGRIREGFRYMKSVPTILLSLILMAIIGTVTFEFQASMPLFVKFILHGDASTYAYVTVAMSVGMLAGGLYNTHSKDHSLKRLVRSALMLGVVTVASSFATTIVFATAGFLCIGIFMIMFSNLSNSLIQVSTESHMRGRMMSYWNMAFQGSTAVGGPLIGWIGQAAGAQWSLAAGGIAALGAGCYGLYFLGAHKEIDRREDTALK